MKAPDQPNTTPPTPAEEAKENQFEKELVDRDKNAPFHQNVYVRTFLGGLLIFGLLLFYIRHISREGHLGTYGGTQPPIVATPADKP